MFFAPKLYKGTARGQKHGKRTTIYTYIETKSARELPIATKVVVHIDKSRKMFFVDQKTVVNGANGHMLMRMYLSPLTKDKAGKDIRKKN